MDIILQPYLYASTPSMDFSGGKYICLKVRGEAFTATNVDPQFQDSTQPDGWHIHIDSDRDDRALERVLQYLKPNLVEQLRPALLRWKLEGGG